MELLRTHSAGSTAVLVRSRAHLIEIVQTLKHHRIPFQAIEIDQLGERQVIEDLMSLTFALLHAADRVAWLALLRAPWCGLTLEDLHALAAADHHATVWDLLHRNPSGLSADGLVRVGRIMHTLEDAIADRGRIPLREWVESTWVRLGGPACVEDQTALEDAVAYFDLLEALAEGADLADFDWFREQVNALFAQPNTSAGDRLQLMTIHKAKGLEFDTVIIPGLDAPPKSDDQRLLLWLEHRGELLLAPIGATGGEKDPIYSYLARIERLKSDQETARLLYVAATRAKQNLHLLGLAKIKSDGTAAQPESRSFLKLLWPLVAQQFAAPSTSPQPDEVEPLKTIRRLPANWQAPAPPPPVKWKRRGIERLQRPEVAFEWAGNRARYAGAALHGFLQRIAREGLSRWNEAAVRSHGSTYRAVLMNLGVPAADLAWAVDQVQAGLLRTLGDARGRWILEDHLDGATELPIAGLIAGDLCEAVIDRTFVDENGVRWIIDYKTSSHEGAGLENFLEREKERYRDQLERYARLMAQRGDEPIRLGLYFPVLGEWMEWAAPAPLRKQAVLFEL